MSKRKKTSVLSKLEEVAARARTMSRLLGEIESIEHKGAVRIKKVEAIVAEKTRPIKAELIDGAKEIRAYAEEHWRELTENGKIKIVDILNAGTMRRYTTPPSIIFEKEDEEGIVNWLADHDLESCIRRRAEVNKEALGQDLPTARQIPGLVVSETEKFVIKPEGRTDRLECAVKSGRWKIVESSSQELPDESKK